MNLNELKNLLSLSDSDIASIKRCYGNTAINRMLGLITDVSGDNTAFPQLDYFSSDIVRLNDNRVFVVYADSDDFDIGKYLFSTESDLISRANGSIGLFGNPFTKEVIYSVGGIELNNKDIMIVCAMNNQYPVAAVSIIASDGSIKNEAIGFSKPKGCNDLSIVLLETGNVVVTYTETLSLDQPIMLAILSEQGELVQKPILITL